jgi:hypothetical protein
VGSCEVHERPSLIRSIFSLQRKLSPHGALDRTTITGANFVSIILRHGSLSDMSSEIILVVKLKLRNQERNTAATIL